MTINFPATVDELRKLLLENGYDPAKVAAMKKPELKQAALEVTSNKFDLQLEAIEKEEPVETLEGAIGVQYCSDGWDRYVMGLFKDNELMDGYPKVNGLRRVANLVLGNIVSSKPSYVFVTQGDTRSVTVSYEIQVEWKLNTPVGFGNMGLAALDVRTFGGLSCCNEDMSSPYGRHPAAVAESKAEGRALRKALGLNVIAAEEMLSGGDTEAPAAKPTSRITAALKSVIEVKAEKLNLVMKELIEKFGLGTKDLGDFTMDDGRKLFVFINEFQQNK